MENLKTFLDLSNDQLRWKGTFEDLKKLVKIVLEVPEEEVGEVNEDKLHKAFTFKIQDASLRYYSTTGNVKVHGTNFNKLREGLLGLICEDAVNQSKSESVTSNDSVTEDCSILERPARKLNDQTNQTSMEDNLIINRLAQKLDSLTREVTEIKKQVSETKNLQETNEGLKQQIIMQSETIKNLLNEKEGLIKTISILSNRAFTPAFTPAFTMNHFQEHSPEPDVIQLSDNEVEPTSNNKTNNAEKKKKNKQKRKKSKGQCAETDVNAETSTSIKGPVNSQERKSSKKTTMIVGDSIVAKLEGWKMSNKDNRIMVKSFSGASVDDLDDYIKPVLRREPDIILHIGTNNLRNDSPSTVVDKIVGICEKIENTLPNSKFAVSQLTMRQDNEALETARKEVNKRLGTFCHNRGWPLLKNSITAKELNNKGLHLNRAGVVALAKVFTDHIRSSYDD